MQDNSSDLIALFQNTLLHVYQSLSGKKWLASFLITGVACYINYFTPFSLWNTKGGFIHSTAWFTLLFTGFLLAGYWISSENSSRSFCKGELLFLLLTAAILFALKITLPYYLLFRAAGLEFLGQKGSAPAWLGGFLWVGLSIAVMHRLREGRWGLYWVHKKTRLYPYLLMLLLMTPLVAGAAASTSFSDMYPRVKELGWQGYSASNWLHYALFELCYLVDFLSIEFFFRGYMIATLSRFLGVQALLPVAFFYFSIHLGKPMAEATGSFFGALVLGSVALQTKSVWGGWIVHAGIALLMELLATLF